MTSDHLMVALSSSEYLLVDDVVIVGTNKTLFWLRQIGPQYMSMNAIVAAY